MKKYLLVGERVWHLGFTPDYKQLLTANGLSNDVSVIDVPSLTVTRSIPVGQLPWGVVVNPTKASRNRGRTATGHSRASAQIK